MTFVVVGAGPTGVELAGAIKEIATRTLRSDFRSKLRAMSGWGSQYWSGRRTARLITGIHADEIDPSPDG